MSDIIQFAAVRRYMEMDNTLYEKCARENTEKQRLKDSERTQAAAKWKSIMDSAAASGINTSM